MDGFLLTAVMCAVISMLGSFIQRVSGFGFGIVVMMVFPFFFSSFGEATTLSGLISLISTSYIAIHYRRNICRNLLLWPLIAYIPMNCIAIWFIAGTDISILKIILGVFLTLLSLYFILFSSGINIKVNILSGLISGGLSGILGGGFAMAGPPIAVYLISAIKTDKIAYLATIQFYFAITGIIATSGRILNGFLTQKVLMLLPIAMISMASGIFIGNKVYKKLNPDTLKFSVYIFMAISGVLIITTEILKKV